MLPLSPPYSGSKSKFVIFVDKNQFNSATKLLCVKIFSRKVVAELFLYLTVLAGNVTLKPNI